MADYREMYLRLFRATTRAIEMLTEAQQECEEIYLSAEEEMLPLPVSEDAAAKRNKDRTLRCSVRFRLFL